MNIFVLDTDPRVAAQMMCDKHIPKMLVEAAQMMASALRRHGVDESELPLTRRGTPYKGGYPHHPCTKWVGDSYRNFMWLYEHAEAISSEYIKRFGKRHRTRRTIREMHQAFSTNFPNFSFPENHLTDFVQAMPDKYKQTDPVKAYRDYYKADKSYFAKWDKGTPAPDWWYGVIT